MTIQSICILLFFYFIIFFILFCMMFQKKTNSLHDKKKQTQALIRQTARWTVASQQDTSPMIALLHANYAAGYLQALELITTEQEINHITNLQKLRTFVYDTQDRAARNVMDSCPQYAGKKINKELALLGISSP